MKTDMGWGDWPVIYEGDSDEPYSFCLYYRWPESENWCITIERTKWTDVSEERELLPTWFVMG